LDDGVQVREDLFTLGVGQKTVDEEGLKDLISENQKLFGVIDVLSVGPLPEHFESGVGVKCLLFPLFEKP
jgi:hypothetical protein